MNSRTLTLIVLSVILGLGATWMANNWLTARLNTSPDDNQQNVVIATVEIAFGQMIEPQQVTVVRMPRDAAPEDAFDTPEKVVWQDRHLLPAARRHSAGGTVGRAYGWQHPGLADRTQQTGHLGAGG